MDPISSSSAGSLAPKPGAFSAPQNLSAQKPIGAPGLGALANMAPGMAAPSAATPNMDATGKEDSVELSLTAQIRSLNLQGQSLGQIALYLGLDTKTVASYLGETA